MATKQGTITAKSIVQLLPVRIEKKHSVRFDAEQGAKDPALTSIYVSKAAMLKAGIDPDAVSGFKVTLEPIA